MTEQSETETGLVLPSNWYSVACEVCTRWNDGVKWTSDLKNYGVAERWVSLPPEALVSGFAYEDCDGIAMSKGAELMDRHGWPRSCLTLVYCLTKPGHFDTGHILLGILPDGPNGSRMYCDDQPMGRLNRVMPWDWYRDAAGYQIISRSTPGEPIDAPWQDIRDGMPRQHLSGA